jgi:hypothetical protein
VTVDRGDGEETGLDDVEIAGFAGLLGGADAETVMKSRVAIEEMARRWRSREVDDAGLRRVHMSNVADYSHVPVRLTR